MAEHLTNEEFAAKFNVSLPEVGRRLVAIGKQEYLETILTKGLPAVQMHWFDFTVASLVLDQVKNVLEIGTRGGDSTIVFAKLFPEATIYTVDTKNPEGQVGHKDEGKQSHRDCNLDLANIVAIRSNSFFLPSLDLPKQFELVFVDGSHEYPQVAGDIMFGYDRVGPGGFLFIHDYVPISAGLYWDVAATIDWMALFVEETVFALPHFSRGFRPQRLMAWLVKGGVEQYLDG